MPEDFINRGGFVHMDRPVVLLSAILDLLRHTKPVFLRGEGTLATSPEETPNPESRLWLPGSSRPRTVLPACARPSGASSTASSRWWTFPVEDSTHWVVAYHFILGFPIIFSKLLNVMTEPRLYNMERPSPWLK